MRWIARFRRNWGPLCLLATVWAGSAGWVFAQADSSNPLRPVSNSKQRDVQPAAAAIGTAIRASEKRTPEVPARSEQPVLAERKVVAERPIVAERSVATEHRRSSPPSRVSNSANAANQSAAVPAAYRRNVSQPHGGFTPAHEGHVGTSVLNGTVTVRNKTQEVIDGGTIYEHGEEPAIGDFGQDDCCGACNGAGCNQCCLLPCPRIRWDDLTIFGGAQGFTGPKNLGQSGSFGFHEGFNWGSPLPCSNGCLAMQLGSRFTQSNLSGAEFTPETRHQTFLTAGLFRRVDWGIQGGLVFDYLEDDWYTKTELTQIRAEVSWVFPCAHELGFWMTNSLNNDTAATTLITNLIPVQGDATWQATDLYAFFYRHQFSGWEGASGRLFAGFSGDSDGLVGLDFQLPLSCDVSLQTGFAYLVPDQAKGPADVGNEQESWNVAISLVWYPGCSTATGKSYYAPLFNVADNGSFMVDRLP